MTDDRKRRWQRAAAVGVGLCLLLGGWAYFATGLTAEERPYAGQWYAVMPHEMSVVPFTLGESGDVWSVSPEKPDGQWRVSGGRLRLNFQLRNLPFWSGLHLRLAKFFRPEDFEAAAPPMSPPEGPIEVRAEGRLQITLYRDEAAAERALEAMAAQASTREDVAAADDEPTEAER